MPFDPVRSYDKPGVLVNQILDGVISFDSVRQLLFEPSRLSIDERQSVVDRIKESVGRNPLTDTLADIALNPFVWLMFLTGPEGPGAVRQFGRLFAGGKEFGGWLTRRASLLKAIGMTSPLDEMAGTPAADTARWVSREVRNHYNFEAELVGPSLRKLHGEFGRRHGVEVRTLDPKYATSNPALKADLDTFNKAVFLEMAGWGRPAGVRSGTGRAKATYEVGFLQRRDPANPKKWGPAEEVPWGEWQKLKKGLRRGRKVGRDTEGVYKLTAPKSYAEGGIDLAVRPGKPPEQLVNQAQVDAVLDAVPGGREYVEKLKDWRWHWLQETWGDKAAIASQGITKESGRFIADPDKVMRWVRAQGKGQKFDSLGEFIGPEAAKAVQAGRVTEARLAELVKAGLESRIDPRFYVPRNVTDVMDLDGSIVSRQSKKAQETLARTHAPGSSRERRIPEDRVMWAPQDLREIGEQFGGTPALATMLETAETRVKKLLDLKTRARLRRIDAHESWHRYGQEMATSEPWRRVGTEVPEIRVAFQDFGPPPVGAKPDGVKDAAKPFVPFDPSLHGNTLDVREQWWKASRKDQPAGGLTVEDLMEGVVNNMDPAKAEVWTKAVVPILKGQHGVEHGAEVAALQWTKNAVEWWTNSWAGRKLKEFGGPSKRFVEGLEGWAKREATVDDATGASGRVIRLLYSSHLGLSTSAIIQNLVQPLGPLMAWGGSKAVGKAYLEAVRRFAEYAEDRVKLGVRPTQEAQIALYDKHFTIDSGIRGPDGEPYKVRLYDLADIDFHAFDAMETPSLHRRALAAERSGEFWLFDMPLKPFAASEKYLNRMTSALTGFHLHKQAGRLKNYDDLVRMEMDSRELVQRTQFGSDPLMRPMIFQGAKNPLSHPMIRMFLQWPFRQASAYLAGGARVGRGTRRIGFGDASIEVPALVGDIVRSAGHAAIAYEVVKNIAGGDISRPLFFGNLEDLTGGGALFTGNQPNAWIPTPPVVDLLAGALRSIGTGDRQLWAETLARITPAGLALQKALTAAPDFTKVPVIGAWQKQYVDWNDRGPDGSVPVYRGDGTLDSRRAPLDIILRSTGTDLGRWGGPTEAARFIVSNNEEIRAMKREALAKMLANDPAGAQRVKEQFEKKFGLPLTISQRQMREAIRNRERGPSRVQRAMATMQKEYRPRYEAFVGEVNPADARYQWSQLAAPGNPSGQ